jgi:hypothetical protein
MARNNIGKTFYVAAGLPATNTAAAFEALTWVIVNGPQVLPQLGISHGQIDSPNVATGFSKSLKGVASGVDTTATFSKISADPGQVILRTAADDSQGLISVKIGTGSGADTGEGPALVTGDPVEYAQGYAHSYTPNQPDTTTEEGFTVSFRQNDFTVEGTEPV